MTRKPKQPKSICMDAFPEQFKSLRPEKSASGGIRRRGDSEAVRMAVYVAINALFAAVNPWCQVCAYIPNGDKQRHSRDDTHHTKGKLGLLLFDVRWFLSSCRWAHVWIGDHPDEARKLGLLCEKGEWNNPPDEKGQ